MKSVFLTSSNELDFTQTTPRSNCCCSGGRIGRQSNPKNDGQEQAPETQRGLTQPQ